VDEEVKEKINLNINKGSLISRAMMKDDSMKVGIKFDVARKMLRTESFPMDKS
jgi:ribosomal protein S25